MNIPTHMAVKPTQLAKGGAGCAIEVACVIASARLCVFAADTPVRWSLDPIQSGSVVARGAKLRLRDAESAPGRLPVGCARGDDIVSAHNVIQSVTYGRSSAFRLASDEGRL
jgi:hypothetical protein